MYLLRRQHFYMLVWLVLFPTFAAAESSYYDSAKVISVTQQTERVNYPRQECRTEYVQETRPSENSVVGAVVGGVAGGLLGGQVGKGTGQVVSAAVGAGVGAIVGDRIASASATNSSRPVERCVTVDNWQTISRGYLVTYQYNGQNYTTVTDTDPGNTIRIRVDISPATSPARVSYQEPALQTVPRYVNPVVVERIYTTPNPMISIIGGWGGHPHSRPQYGPHGGFGGPHGGFGGPHGHYPGW